MNYSLKKMEGLKKILVACCFLSTVYNLNAQSSIVRDTSNFHGQIKVQFTISTDLDSLQEFIVNQYNNDSLLVYSGVYNSDEDDPSSFLEFNYDDENNQIIICTGLFESNELSTKIWLQNTDGIIEENTID